MICDFQSEVLFRDQDSHGAVQEHALVYSINRLTYIDIMRISA